MKRLSGTLAAVSVALTLGMTSCSAVKNLTSESLNGEWNVTLLDGERIEPAENTPYIGFDAAENRMFGFTGCNRLVGGASVTDILAGKADFSRMGVTRMACHDDKYEQKFLSALGRVKKAVAGKSVVKLVDESGKTVMELTSKK